MPAISSDLEQFVEQEVASGRYANRDAVIAHALEFLKSDREEATAGILAGLADVATGRLEPLDRVFDELRRELNAEDA